MKHKRLTARVLAAALVLAVFIGLGIVFDMIGLVVMTPIRAPAAARIPRRLQPKRNVSRSSSRWKKPSGTSGAAHRS